VQLGEYMAEFYTVNGMVLESRKRREHLTEEDLQKNRFLQSIQQCVRVSLSMFFHSTLPRPAVYCRASSEVLGHRIW
jgi:hypothetical protein